MTEKKYRVQDLVKFDYSEIGGYIGEGYSDKPLRNDEIVDLLNDLTDNRNSLARGFDKYQAKVGYVIGKYGRMFNRNTVEFQLIEEIADELGFDLESMEAKDGYNME